MLCFSLRDYARACSPVTGGLSDIITFDPDDFNFSQPQPVNGIAQPYMAISHRPGAEGTGATGAEGEVTITDAGDEDDEITVEGVTVVVAAAETPTTLAGKVVAAITAANNGYSATNLAGVITITAPASYGNGLNGADVTVSVTGTVAASSTAAYSSGVDGTGRALMYKVSFLRDEASWDWKQSVKGCSVKYEHTFGFQLPENSQNLTTFMQALDAASCCCGLGLIIRMNGGKIFVAGEKWVNSSSIGRFTIAQNGSTGGSGKLYDDFNGGNLVLTGPFSRSLYEYVGEWSDVEALMN